MSGLALRCMTVAHRVRMQGLYVRSGAQDAYHAGHAGRGAQNRASGALMHADMSAQQVARKQKWLRNHIRLPNGERNL